MRPDVSSAGRSALDGYRQEVRRRRRSLLRCGAALVFGAGLGWAASRAAGSAREVAGGCALGLLLAAVFLRPAPDPERWLRGAAGEEATARLLERLSDRSRGWTVLHDLAVPGSRANIDHLVIGPSGAWVIDTKTTRGYVERGLFGALSLGGRRLDTGPVRFEARVVADRLGVRVRPLVVIHGAGLPRRGARFGGVKVVAGGDVVGWLRRGWWWRWTGWRRTGRLEVLRLTRLAESIFPPAGCVGRSGGGR